MIVLKATQEHILAALQSVAGIVERRHTLPILANVMIRKTGSDVQLTTSDLEIQIRTQASLGGDSGNFSTTVGARKLMDILRSMPSDQTVSLESNQNKLLLKSGKSRFTLQTLPAEDFPLVQESTSFGPLFSIPQKTLKTLLQQISFAMAVHDIRYYLNGILFVAEGKQLSLVATDGHRLFMADLELPDAAGELEPQIIPRRFIDAILKHFGKVNGPVRFRVGTGRLFPLCGRRYGLDRLSRHCRFGLSGAGVPLFAGPDVGRGRAQRAGRVAGAAAHAVWL